MGFNPASLLKEPITYWPPSGGEDQYGNPTHTGPQLLRGRWEERSEEVTANSGEAIISKAIVYVSEDVAVEGYLARGDFVGQSDPGLASATQVRVFQRIPALRSATYERRAIL
jgi:hypothetical protein